MKTNHLKTSLTLMSINQQKIFVNRQNTKIDKKNEKKTFILSQYYKYHKWENTTKSNTNYKYLTASYASIAKLIGFKPGKRNQEDSSIFIFVANTIMNISLKFGEWRRSGKNGIYFQALKGLGEFSNNIFDEKNRFILDSKIEWLSTTTKFSKFYHMTVRQFIQKLNDVLKYFFKNSDLQPQRHHTGNSVYAKDFFASKTNGKNLKENLSCSSKTTQSPKEKSLTHKFICLLNAKIATKSNCILKNKKENYEKYLFIRKKYEKVDKLIKLFIEIMQKIGNDNLFTWKIHTNKKNKRNQLIIMAKKSTTKLHIKYYIRNIFLLAKNVIHCKTENHINQLYESIVTLMKKPITIMMKLRKQKDIAIAYKDGKLINKEKYMKMNQRKFALCNLKPIDFKKRIESISSKILLNTPFEDILSSSQMMPSALSQCMLEQQKLILLDKRLNNIQKQKNTKLQEFKSGTSNEYYNTIVQQYIQIITNQCNEIMLKTDKQRKLTLEKKQAVLKENNQDTFLDLLLKHIK